MKEVIVIEIDEKEASDYNDNYAMCFRKDEGKSKLLQVPETWEDLRKIASDMCIEKKIDLRFLDDSSFEILLPNKKLIFCSLNSIKKSYYKLLWALEE